MKTSPDESSVNNDARVSDEERSLFRLLAYFIVSWILLSELGRRLLPEFVGVGGAAFVVTLGSWFVDRSKSSKVAFLPWVGISTVSGLLVASVLYLVNRLWPVV